MVTLQCIATSSDWICVFVVPIQLSVLTQRLSRDTLECIALRHIGFISMAVVGKGNRTLVLHTVHFLTVLKGTLRPPTYVTKLYSFGMSRLRKYNIR